MANIIRRRRGAGPLARHNAARRGQPTEGDRPPGHLIAGLFAYKGGETWLGFEQYCLDDGIWVKVQ